MDEFELIQTPIDLILRKRVEVSANDTVLTYPALGVEWSYSDLDVNVDRFVVALQNVGAGPGVRIGVMLANRPEYAALWFACVRIGAIMVPINVRFQVQDTANILGLGRPEIVVAETHTMDVLSNACFKIGREIVILNVDSLVVAVGHDKVARSSDAPVESSVSIQYTSGSSGMPKGCVLSQRYWLALAAKNVFEVPGIVSSDVLLTAQPFSYMDPQWALLSTVVAGARLVVLDGFHPSSFWQSVQDSGATFFYCLGVMPRLLLTTPVKADERTHALRLVACSGIPREDHAGLVSRFGVDWVETYGMTEIGNGASVLPQDAKRFVGSGVVGRPTKLREFKVVDDAGELVPMGARGELLVRGIGVMEGYFEDEAANRQSFSGSWFRTGDLVRVIEDGFVEFVGRKKGMIRRSGENISPEEIELVVARHPAVVLVACLGVPDAIRGEEVKAVIQLAPGWNDDVLPDLVAHCKSNLASFKVPRYWETRPDLPLTASSKVSKAALVREGVGIAGGWDRVAELGR